MTQFLAASWIWILLIGGMLVMHLGHGRRMGGMGHTGTMGGGCGGGQAPSSGGRSHLSSPGVPGDWRSDPEHANPSAAGYANSSPSGHGDPSLSGYSDPVGAEPPLQAPVVAGRGHRHGGC